MSANDDFGDPVVAFSTSMHSHDPTSRAHRMPWSRLAERLATHRAGVKDGPAVICGQFSDDGRKAAKLVRRSLIGLDIETHKTTGEVPPRFTVVIERLRAKQLAAVGWTTFNHTEALPRYRLILPLTKPLEYADMTADQASALDRYLVPLVAVQLRLQGVIDRGKLGAESLLYTARHPEGQPHRSTVVAGGAIPTDTLVAVARMMMSGRQMSEAQRARLRQSLRLPPEIEAVIAGYNETNPLHAVLARYGWHRNGNRFRSPFQHPASQPATRIIDIGEYAGMRFFSWSESDVAAGFGQPCQRGGCWGSAFDLFRHIEHGGDFKAAIEAARASILASAATRTSGRPR